MNKKEEIIQILNNRGLQIDDNLNIIHEFRSIPLNEIIDPFLEDGQYNHLNFDADHICNEIVIPSLEMLEAD